MNIFFVSPDPERALGLEGVVRNFTLLYTDQSSLGINLGQLSEGAHRISIPDPSFRKSSELLKLEDLHSIVEGLEGPNYLQVFKISPQIELQAERLGLVQLNTTSQMNRRFEQKISQYTEFEKAGLEDVFPKSFIDIASEKKYLEVSRELGERFVIQRNSGHTGSGTHFIESPEGFTQFKLKYGSHLVKFSEVIDGDSWTTNAVIYDGQAYFHGMSYQYTGISPLTSNPGTTVGNDWSQTDRLSASELKSLDEIYDKVEKLLVSSGYEGLFGLDMITDGSRFYLIEINARQPASTGMHAKLNLRQGLLPLPLLHITQFLSKHSDASKLDIMESLLLEDWKHVSENLETKLSELKESRYQPISASQVIFRNETGGELVYKQKDLFGLYENGERDASGYNLTTASENSYHVIETEQGRQLSPSNEYARIQALEQIVDSGDNVTQKFKDIINNLLV